MNGSPVGRFSKERQDIGKGLGRLLEKMDSNWTSEPGRLRMDAGWKQPIHVGRGRTLDADRLLCKPRQVT